jgi:pimeloyl-ACP methyl ester carboxylesterase
LAARRLGSITALAVQPTTTRKREIEAIGEVAGEALAAGGGLLRDFHGGIAERSFGAVGPMGAPVRVIHDAIAKSVYNGLRAGSRAVMRAGGRAAAAATQPEKSLIDNPLGSAAVAALNGMYGNHLASRRNGLALGMEVRRRGAAVPIAPDSLATQFPDATPRLAIFVHGLCENDAFWRRAPRGREAADPRPYGERLRDERGITPVYVRYNSGLHVPENGRALAELIEELADAWPTEVEEVALVGHSMGGLVARSACHYGELGGHRWPRLARHVFCLGAPHLGADLEKGVNAASAAFARLPETRPIATLLNARSDGVKDMRYGSCVEEDWCDCDPDEFLRDRCREVPFLAGANYYFLAATVNPDPVGRLVGDLLVRLPSASGAGTGRGRRIPFEVERGRHLSGLTHFDLLNHPSVYAQLDAWLR